MNKRFLLLILLLLLRADISASASTPCAILSANPASLTFPIIVDGAKDTMSLVIKNTGDLSWSPNAPIITPNDGSFTILSFDTTSIPPGGSKKIIVEFLPLSVSKDTAKITFPNAGPCGNNLSINLYGEGGCAVLTNSTPQIPNTGILEKSVFRFTIVNVGNYPWDPGIAVITPPRCFKIISITPDPIIAASVIAMEFSPTEIGQCCALLSFPNSGPCGNSLIIDLCGLGEVNTVKPTANSEGFILDQNFPNPFTNKTSFNYSIPKETEVSIALNDLTGKFIRTIINGRVSAGKHLVTFDVSSLPSGTYMYVLESGTTRIAREFILKK